MKQIFTTVCSVMLLLVSVHAQIPTNGLVAWYPFSGNANDASGNGYNGTNNGATLTADRFGKASSAYSFNGKTSYINIGYFTVSTYSLCSWVYNTAVNPINLSAIISKLGGNIPYKGYELRVQHDSTIMLVCGNGDTWVQPNTSFKLKNNKWYFIVATCSKGSINIYIDKQLIASYSISNFFDNSFNILIGTRDPSVSNGGFYSGNLDDIRIYNRALDSLEVKALYHEGGYDTTTNGIPTNGLVAWYPFSGNTLDSSGNNNHGTNNGATLTADRFGKANSAYSFDGQKSNIIVKNSILSNVKSSFSINLWLNMTKDTTIDLFNDRFGTNCSYKYRLLILNKTLNFWKYNTSTGSLEKLSTPSMPINSWQMITAIFDTSRNEIRLYIGGILKASNTSTNWFSGTNPTIMGALDGCNLSALENLLFGKLDDIRIYNRALDSTEINALYHEGGYDTATNILPTNGLVAWYPFSGNTLDSSGNNNHGTNNGATLTADRFGKANSAYSFNGISDFIRCLRSGPSAKSNRTVSIWVKTDIILPNGRLINYGGNDNSGSDFNITYSDNGNNCRGIGVGFTGTGKNNNSFDLDKNNWTNYTIVGIGTTIDSIIVYRNSVPILSYCFQDPTNNTMNTQDINPLTIGRYHWLGYTGNVGYFKGLIDDIRIYNRALDSTEIQALYHEGGYDVGILPVSLNSFSATRIGSIVTANWATATELNTNHFYIQRSLDGKSFTNIGTVKAVGTGANSYEFTDKNPVSGTNYYRLQNVDKDGSTTYSKVVTVQFSANNKPLTIYPNPTTNSITISGNHISKVQVIDNMGKIVAVKSFKDATNPLLSVHTLNAGVYHLRIESVDGGTTNVGFIKQ